MDLYQKGQITIGVPVYNEERFILDAITSAVNQTDCLIISDNASTDRTGDICKKFAQDYKNVIYHRHETNMGSVKNFYYPLDIAKTEYFMWLGGHDLIPEGYVTSLLNSFKANPEAVLAYSPVDHIDVSDNFISSYDYHYHMELASDNPFVRVQSLISNLHDCSLFNGIFKTECINQAWVDTPCVGQDHVILCRAASIGPFIYNTNTKFICRSVRDDDQANFMRMERLTGKVVDKTPLYRDMQVGQLEVIKHIKSRNYYEKLLWLLKAKRKLIRRFGDFNEADIDLYRNIIENFFRVAEKINMNSIIFGFYYNIKKKRVGNLKVTDKIEEIRKTTVS